MLSDRRPPAPRRGTDCSVDKLLKSLPDGEAEALRGMLADRLRWTATAIYKACADEGYEVGRQTVARHRNGACRCES